MESTLFPTHDYLYPSTLIQQQQTALYSFMQSMAMLFPNSLTPMKMLSPSPYSTITPLAFSQGLFGLDRKEITSTHIQSNLMTKPLAVPENSLVTKSPSVDYLRPLGVIDKYLLFSELGKDHLYPVYIASSIFDSPSSDGSNLVVLKAIPVADFRNSFQNESNVFQLKYHKNLLNCIEIIKNVRFYFSTAPKISTTSKKPTTGDEFYNLLILKYHANGDFLEILRKHRFNERITRYYFGQLLDAVEYMHLQGYCHRDIKLENILFDQNFDLILSDFGHSVKYCDKKGEKIFKESSSMTTPGICPPEFHQGKGYKGTQMDIFAVGKLLLIFMTGLNPFKSTKESDQNYSMIIKGQWPAYWKLTSGWMKKRWIKADNFSNEFKALVEMMLNPDPKKRISTVQLVRESPWFKNVKPASTEEVQMEIIRMKTQQLDGK